jgi:hypothetical protein
MDGKRQLLKPTLGVVIRTGAAVIVPAGQIVAILTPTVDERETVDVIWSGKHLMMFVRDLEERTQSI